MLLRSSSTPFPHHFLSSSSPSSRRSSLHLRRAFSDGHLPSLHPSSLPTPNDAGSNPGGGLHTELSFSIYNTFGGKDQSVAAPLASSSGLGIDRIASGFFTAGADKTGCGGANMERVEEQDEAVAALDAQYKTMVDEQPGNALFLRNYAQFLHEVKGDTRRAEEYYSRAMLADPSDGEIMSQYAKLVWEVHHDPERCLGYFQKSVQAAPHDSHVLAAYASFLWEQDDDDDCGEQGTGGAAAPQRAAGTGQAMELTSAAV
uniref:TmcB/TmcC TPR repeats domain-containing protein n=1 Tax=Saccharum hybrid cultivar R570 TaxID=131158 RepID=A0A059Q0U9_9POAL|nr:hypothetical protein SHCRBa_120_L03_F_150 [Saccharum hybrid cultivar R570]